MSRGEVPDVLVGQIAFGKEVVAEHLHEVAGEARLLAFGELARLDAEIARHLEQEVDRNAPAVVLDQVQVAGGNAERLRQACLAQPLQAPQPLDPAADLQVAAGHDIPLQR